jgi:hypothetical protein
MLTPRHVIPFRMYRSNVSTSLSNCRSTTPIYECMPLHFYTITLFSYISSHAFFTPFAFSAFFFFSILLTTASAPIPPNTNPTPTHCIPVT